MAKQNDGLAHFEVCYCGRHGRIVFPDGRTGGEIISRSGVEANYLFKFAMLADRFQNVVIFPQRQLLQVVAEIGDSTLPHSEEQLEGHFRKQISTWNAAKLLQPNLNPASFHEIMGKMNEFSAFED